MAKFFKKSPKCADKDYSRDLLPTTRREVFFDVLRLHLRELIICGLVMLCFCLPMHAVAVIEDLTVMDLTERFSGDSAEQVQIREYTIFVAQTNSAILKIFCFLAIGLALSGISRIIKRLSWEQSVHFTTDFAQGVRSNAKHMVILSFLAGLVNLFVVFCNGLAKMEQSGTLAVAMSTPAVIAILFLLPVAGYTVVSISIYQNKLKDHIGLAFNVFAKKLPVTLTALLCCILVYIPQTLPYFVLHIAGRLIGTLVSPIVFLGWYLFSLNQFDDVINKHRFPELVNKGIIWPED